MIRLVNCRMWPMLWSTSRHGTLIIQIKRFVTSVSKWGERSQYIVAIKPPHHNDKDVGSNPTATRNEKLTFGGVASRK